MPAEARGSRVVDPLVADDKGSFEPKSFELAGLKTIELEVPYQAGSQELPWQDSGTQPGLAKPWSWPIAIGGSLVFAIFVVLLLPFLAVIAVCQTFLEMLRRGLGLDPYITESEEGQDEDVIFVLPANANYAFWQGGMVQYLCERYDTTGARFVTGSSGACATIALMALEEAAEGAPSGREAAERVRQRAHEIFESIEARLAPLTWWPMAFFSRMGGVLETVIAEMVTEGIEIKARERLTVGVHRLATNKCIPAFVPDVLQKFESRDALVDAVRATATLPLLVTPKLWTRVRPSGERCSDAAHILSFFPFIEFLLQKCNGIAERTVPAHAHAGFNRYYAIVQCSCLRMMLPKRGRVLWVTASVGGHLRIWNLVNFSGYWMMDTWRRGYEHARELDREGHWQGLPRRSFGDQGAQETV